MERLPHGYTNVTRRLAGGIVEKTYVDSARERAKVEVACLAGLAGRFPVPAVVSFDPETSSLLMREAPGVHGQELIDAGHGFAVLGLVGRTFASLQRVPAAAVPDLVGEGHLITHGDFGPQNMLFDLDRMLVTVVLDWEFAHLGAMADDLAWAEWIVRMHHPAALDTLPALFEGATVTPPWRVRHETMFNRCEEILRLCAANGHDAAAALWRVRTETTSSWVE